MNRFIAAAAIALVAAGCGRREERAWFDATRAAAPLALAAKALPASSLRVRWTRPDVPREIQADSYFSLPVTLTNIGDVAWPDKAAGHPQKRDGSFAVRVTHAWTHGSDRVNARAGALRTDLPRSVAPGETITVVLELHAPAQPGEYQLVVDLLQELVQWFSDVGADSLTIPCRVVAAAGAAPRPVP